MRGLFGGLVVGLMTLVAFGDMAEAQDATSSRDVPCIVVEGSATTEVTPDLALVTLGVATARPLAGDAAADNNAVAAGLLDQIRSEGISPADIQTSQTSLVPVFDQIDGAKIKGFSASSRLGLRARSREGRRHHWPACGQGCERI